jgi:methionine sulfoxide reductase catalytic subunit
MRPRNELVGFSREEEVMRHIDPAEVTPEHVYVNRRRFMVGIGAAAAGVALAACTNGDSAATPTAPAGSTPGATPATDELGAGLTSFDTATTYNNYYEFSLSKEGVAKLAYQFHPTPWTVEVGGLVRKPRSFSLDDLLSLGQEERIYRMRCVEGWSMVLPWVGFPLSRLLEVVEPKAEAQYVQFETVYRPEEMDEQNTERFSWPYVEGLRLDEALHDLTILATGLYGKPLPVQNGAPIRLVVPWKYGFKSIKSIVKIDLVAPMPSTFWNALSPEEYGFYANVNPDVPHPRWSQATERRIGESGRRATLLFNGYADEVAALYADMDLAENY